MFTVKRGDTFAFTAEIEGLAVPVANLKCQVRDMAYKLIAEMAISESGTPGTYLFEAPDTQNWPIGTLLYDIKINISGKATSTATDRIEVIKDVTRYE